MGDPGAPDDPEEGGPPPPEPEPVSASAPQPQPSPPAEPEAEPGPEPAAAPPRRRGRPGGGMWRALLLIGVLIVFVGPIITVAAYRFIPPPVTALMLINLAKGRGMDYRWRSLDDISATLPQAAIAAEDARFCEHHGFDFEAMNAAMRHNERRPGRVRGGSTISQQTAKNVFLWPDRSYVRKGLEAYFTVLIEGLWGKRRIMEVYLNVAEWGPGTYGAQAAARRYFRKDAADLTGVEAARLTAILPSPLKWKAASPGPYVQRRSRRIGGAMGTVRQDGLAACLR